MGLAASQARLLLLTAKNNALELQAQLIESERLMLAQEQEIIANKYSEKTSNQIMITTTTDAKGDKQEETTTLQSLAKAANGETIIITDASGTPLCAAKAELQSDGSYKMTYYNGDGSQFTGDASSTSNIVGQMNNEGFNTRLQLGLANGSLHYMQPVQNSQQSGENTGEVIPGFGGKYERKVTESLNSTTSRYYTEDDAAAQAEYNAAMARVNALDTRLENKLNQVETQKKAVEQELESVNSLIQSNVERTFKYFG